MDACLLCLQRKKDENEVRINANSIEWLEDNIEKIIEKYFWKLKLLSFDSWLCLNCWRTLHDFHKFHEGIEEAHAFLLTTQVKTETTAIDGTDDEASNYKYEAINTPEVSQKIELALADVQKTKTENLFSNEETDNEPAIVIKHDINPSQKFNKLKDPLQKLSKVSVKLTEDSNKRKTRRQNKRKQYLDESSIEESDAVISKTKPSFDSEEVLSDFISCDAELKTRLYHQEQNKFVTENYTIKCGICQSEMETFQDVRKHCAMEHQQSGYVVCCNKKFYRRNILVEHLNWHLNPEYFKCKVCGKVLADRRCLEIHAQVHEAVERTYICDACGKAFARPRALERHKLCHLPIDERNFACQKCPKRFGSNVLLVEHTRSAHVTKHALICYICGKGMRTTTVYKRHMQQHEGIQPPTHSCDICGLKLTDAHRLKTHKANRHPEKGQKDFKCHLCPKISPNAKALSSHIKYKHKLGLDFKCTICEKAFKRAVSLKEHIATHTGTELYVCPHCPKTFKSNANMHSHRKKAHPQMWEEAHRERYSGKLPPNLRITST